MTWPVMSGGYVYNPRNGFSPTKQVLHLSSYTAIG